LFGAHLTRAQLLVSPSPIPPTARAFAPQGKAKLSPPLLKAALAPYAGTLKIIGDGLNAINVRGGGGAGVPQRGGL
jgi:hypothetical protein